MLEKKLEHRNIKPTAVRLLVLKALVESSAAVSLNDLEAKFERADKATLYRTLKTFEDKKLIHSIDDGSGATKYALCAEGCECEPQDQHIHFHCVKCNETYCLTQSKIPQTNIPVGFRASSASMVYKGTCPNCL
ncbi:Fur family transcriptional regulator [Roseivirga sp. 4D4]|uniref:Fur family transcriptional regulator n=1 Tax=Roseivirga sp. 4D4 TaxID=1889784 RepID=UPI00085365FD|nr:transcriptional repressor [Roseivirga sp. 4D4]OEK03065.1 Fur family transcriptional regulator [Roseivirga sp. 4D4]